MFSFIFLAILMRVLRSPLRRKLKKPLVLATSVLGSPQVQSSPYQFRPTAHLHNVLEHHAPKAEHYQPEETPAIVER